jgi:hypothetical protein
MINDVPGQVSCPNSQLLSMNDQYGDTYSFILFMLLLGKGLSRYPVIFIPVMLIIYCACLGA